ncbi:hypothetical protein PGH45_16210 [Legionella pneumophila]|nr:hypothetical protein [Legionella pneumophila]
MLVIRIIQVSTPFPQQFQSWDKFESKGNMTPEFANLMDIKIKTSVLLINLNSFVLKIPACQNNSCWAGGDTGGWFGIQ